MSIRINKSARKLPNCEPEMGRRKWNWISIKMLLVFFEWNGVRVKEVHDKAWYKCNIEISYAFNRNLEKMCANMECCRLKTFILFVLKNMYLFMYGTR